VELSAGINNIYMYSCIRCGAVAHHVGLDGVAHVLVHVDVHVEQLRQVEVHLGVAEAEQPVADVGLDARLLGAVQVGDGHGHVEQLGLKQAQQPRLPGGAASLAAPGALHGAGGGALGVRPPVDLRPSQRRLLQHLPTRPQRRLGIDRRAELARGLADHAQRGGGGLGGAAGGRGGGGAVLIRGGRLRLRGLHHGQREAPPSSTGAKVKGQSATSI